MPAVAEQARERRPPRPAADDDRPFTYALRTKSIDDRHALELEPLAQLVLDPVAVVARDEAGSLTEKRKRGGRVETCVP